jgi:hypothetical protein
MYRCPKKYTGQTGRNFKTRYREHIQSIRLNNANSKYSQHILDTQHAYGPITDIMEVLQFEKKGQLINPWERFHIYKLSRDNLQMNDMYTDIHNPIFKLVNSHYNSKN